MSTRPHLRSGRAGGQRGLLLPSVLVFLALATLAVAGTSQRWADARRRADEAELLFVGEQYRQAIQAFWRESPGGVRRWPTRLDELLEDRRFPVPRRYLRRLYPDPLAPERPWGLVQQGAAVVGVYSEAPGQPFRQTGFSAAQRGFDNATRYADWRFVADAAQPAAASAPVRTPIPSAGTPAGTSPANRPGAFDDRRLR
jgi:type II secretory pathway pseudopilin PulG